MKKFITAAAKLDLTVEEVLDILDLTVEDAENENLSVNEIIESVQDTLEDSGCYDWKPFADSCSHYCNA
jgi:hypothetical protein